MSYLKEFKKWNDDNPYLAVKPEQYAIIEKILKTADTTVTNLKYEADSNKHYKINYIEEMKKRIKLEKENKIKDRKVIIITGIAVMVTTIFAIISITGG